MTTAGSSRRRVAAPGAALAAVLCATLFASARPAAAGDPPAPAAAPDPLEAEADAIRRLTASGQWRAGKTAIEKFFAAHPSDPRVLAYLPSVESDLKRCLFRLAGPQPSVLELLGRSATKYEPLTARATFEAWRKTEDLGWTTVGELVWFDAMFDGEVEVELSGEGAKTGVVVLAFDFETLGGYSFHPTPDRYGASWGVFRVDPGRGAPARLDKEELFYGSFAPENVRYSLSQSKVRIEIEYPKGWKDRKSSLSVADTRYRRGYVALGGSAIRDESLKITGKLDPTFANRQIASADGRRFREWQAKEWNREKTLPASLLALEEGADAWKGAAPPGWPEGERDRLAALHLAAFDDGPKDDLSSARGLTGAAIDWQTALFARIDGRLADAEAAARRVHEAAPAFGGAPALVGRCLLQRGAAEEAVLMFEESRRRDPAFAPAYDGLALAALRDGDPLRMQAALSAGAAARTSSSLTDALRQALVRLRRGPDWKKKFESFTAHYMVSSDVSPGVCNDIGKVLEESAAIYAKQFRQRPAATRSRVRVFADFAGYADYVSELGANPDNTLGMYIGSIRELCVWLHEERAELSNTIRHEAFHQYLDDFLDGAPIWLNEGYAEFFGFSRRVAGKAVVGQVGEDQGELARKLLPKFKPLDKLFLMEPKEFMADAGVHYVQSWAVIHLLRSSETSRPILDRYVDALLAGRSRKQAFDEVLAPQVAWMEKALEAHVKAMDR